MSDTATKPPQGGTPPVEETGVIEQTARDLAKQPKTLRDMLRSEDFAKALRDALPKAMRPERFVRVALTALMKTPDLMDCSRESLFKALLDLSSYGLEPDGRRAHLIPFKSYKKCQCGHEMDVHKGQECSKCDCRQRRVLVECQLIIDYKGLAELVRRSGDVSYIHADVVYEHDHWDFAYGSNAHLDHKPAVERGDGRVAFYSFVRFKDGTEDFIVMSPGDVEKIRKRSKAADAGPWSTDYDEMGKKTVFRRHSKWLPLSPEVREAAEREDTDAVDISGWEEAIEGPKSETKRLPDAGAARQKLRDALLPKPEEAPPEK